MNEHSILIAGRSCDRECQQDAQVWQSLLAKQHGDGPAVCQCDGHGPRHLSVRKIGGRYYLARYPDSADGHADDCLYYLASPDKSGMAGYESGVVEELEGGEVRVRLKKATDQASEPGKDQPTLTAPVTHSGGRRQPTMSILGLCHLLFERSGLNVWRPGFEGKRDASTVGRMLRSAAKRVIAGGKTLDTMLLTPGQSQNNRIVLSQAIQSRGKTKRLIAVGCLANYDEARKSKRYLQVLGSQGYPYLWVTDAQREELEKRFPRAYSAWLKKEPVIFVADLCKITFNDDWNSHGSTISDIAIFQTTPEWIPVESSYEAMLARNLIGSKRSFRKPLRFDADNDVIFPDFILTDMPRRREYPMEVFGRTDQ